MLARSTSPSSSIRSTQSDLVAIAERNNLFRAEEVRSVITDCFFGGYEQAVAHEKGKLQTTVTQPLRSVQLRATSPTIVFASLLGSHPMRKFKLTKLDLKQY